MGTIIPIPAPLGVFEWECTDGRTFYSRASAQAHQDGLNKLAEIADKNVHKTGSNIDAFLARNPLAEFREDE
jgi:hypothetical protein